MKASMCRKAFHDEERLSSLLLATSVLIISLLWIGQYVQIILNLSRPFQCLPQTTGIIWNNPFHSAAQVYLLL